MSYFQYMLDVCLHMLRDEMYVGCVVRLAVNIPLVCKLNLEDVNSLFLFCCSHSFAFHCIVHTVQC